MPFSLARLACAVLAVAVTGCAPAPTAVAACATSRDCASGQVCLDDACVVSFLRDGGTGCGADCECTSDAQCAASVAACVEAACLEGSCFFRARDERCSEGVCDIRAGCTSDADGGALTSDASSERDGSIDDAGARDAGASDGGPSDGGARDGGPSDSGPSDSGPRDSGIILRRDSGLARPVGSACTEAAQCAAPTATSTAVCLPPDGSPPMPGGYCSATCSVLTSGSCGPNASCVRLGEARSAHCLDLCATDLDCRTREGYSCVRASGTLTGERVCVAAIAI